MSGAMFRKDAKQGDIFSPEISEQFVKVIRGTLQGSNANATNVRRTIRQGEPVAGVHLTANGVYPEHLPLTTVPPTLLGRLPPWMVPTYAHDLVHGLLDRNPHHRFARSCSKQPRLLHPRHQR